MNQETSEKKPIKRHKVLQPLSRDHHHTLLLAWKIRKGLITGIEPVRIKNYVNWFYKTYAAGHFELEEKFIYTVLEAKDERIQKALAEHEQLRALFTSDENIATSLPQLADLLESHIRFEERELFNVIQENAGEEQLRIIEQNSPDEKFVENEEYVFWG